MNGYDGVQGVQGGRRVKDPLDQLVQVSPLVQVLDHGDQQASPGAEVDVDTLPRYPGFAGDIFQPDPGPLLGEKQHGCVEYDPASGPSR